MHSKSTATDGILINIGDLCAGIGRMDRQMFPNKQWKECKQCNVSSIFAAVGDFQLRSRFEQVASSLHHTNYRVCYYSFVFLAPQTAPRPVILRYATSAICAASALIISRVAKLCNADHRLSVKYLLPWLVSETRVLGLRVANDLGIRDFHRYVLQRAYIIA
jgi:hypothetical protein